ncbi:MULTISPECIES: hypothetical protein [unclassified Pseudoalteromonas]|uniref:hypothetical protein n=1 Tax=unclassified Pseudoalteromonas TaxID=194690 RepID=UPI00040A46AB|nr:MULTISPECIES: hypothetical protein [unclassified Pseudoalteromonas]
MIKIPNLEYLSIITKAQNNINNHANYLIDVLKPAIKHGDWDKFEKLDIGFDTNGNSLGKIVDNEAWKKLQQFLLPNASTTQTLDFSLDGKIIERNLQNELKSLILKMMWLSPRENSFATLYQTLVDLKKCIKPLLLEGVNSFAYIDINLLEKWAIENSTSLNFRRETIYSSLNKLFIEQDGLPFDIALTNTLSPSDIGLSLTEREQFSVIPQRLYWRALTEAESLINNLYPIRDKIEMLSNYLITFKSKIYKGYASYLHQGVSVRPSGEYIWRLENSNKNSRIANRLFLEAFTKITSPTKVQIIGLLEQYEPSIKESFYDKCYPERHIIIGNEAISNQSQAERILTKYSGVCVWALMAKSGMRGDEIYELHTVMVAMKKS